MLSILSWQVCPTIASAQDIPDIPGIPGIKDGFVKIQSALSKDQLSKIEQGQLIQQSKSIQGAAWPQVIIYGKIKASPLQSIAIYLALDHQKAYVPGLLKSQVIEQLSATKVLTKYELDLPFPIPNAHYTHGSDFKKLPADLGYQAKWWMVKSSSTKFVAGEMAFFKNADQTFFVYKNFVKPKSFFARFLKGSMLKDTLFTIQTIRSYIEECVKSKPKLLKKYVNYIQQSLAGKFVYTPKKK